MEAIERLHAARVAANNGQHEEALREFIWFHHHALEENRALYGVRLSFGLAPWVELGKVYPQALRALEAIRDEKANALLGGEGDAHLFHDVAAINDYLGTAASTYSLYATLAQTTPELARRIGPAALPAVAAARDYALARQIVPDPEAAIRDFASLLNQDVARIKHTRFSPAPRRWGAVHGFVQNVQLQLDIAKGKGETPEAARLGALALRLIPDPSLRTAVKTAFARRARVTAAREQPPTVGGAGRAR